MSNKMMFTLWDVEHGLSIWIRTPKGHNHWIDAGHNNETDFSPAKHVANTYGEKNLDYLIISHPDEDHIEGLPELIEHLGEPRVICRNKSLPDKEKYGDCKQEYQKLFRDIDKRYNSPVAEDQSPSNPSYNGGIEIGTFRLKYVKGMSKNNSSVVVFYLYARQLFVFPGDIEKVAWTELYKINKSTIDKIVRKAGSIIMVAPHHGRGSGYYKDIFDDIGPHIVLISDKHGKEPTDPRFYTAGQGIKFSNGETISSLSTKTANRIQITVNSDGSADYDYTT